MDERIMEDAEVVRIARAIDKRAFEIRDLVARIENGRHRKTEAIIASLNDNQIPILAWATHVVHTDLEYPWRWETGDFGIRRNRK